MALIAFTPLAGSMACACLPRVFTFRRTRPFSATLISFMLPAMSGMTASVQWMSPCSMRYGSPTPTPTSSSPTAPKVNAPWIRSACVLRMRSAAKAATSGPLSSRTPRPYSLPFFSNGSNGLNFQSEGAPLGTVSVCSRTSMCR